jgi:hypothetical protein
MLLSKISDLNDNFELDPETHWVKAYRADGDFYLIEPRCAREMGLWFTQRRMDLIQAEEHINREKGAQADQE